MKKHKKKTKMISFCTQLNTYHMNKLRINLLLPRIKKKKQIFTNIGKMHGITDKKMKLY